MGRLCGLVVAAGLALMAALPAWAGKAPGGNICPSGWGSAFNGNGVGCTFCNNPDTIVGPDQPPLCFAAPRADPCEGADVSECCELTPCASGCPDFDSLACNVSTCECDPEECCQTICPEAVAPVLGSPISPAFSLVAVALACAGAFVLVRQRS